MNFFILVASSFPDRRLGAMEDSDTGRERSATTACEVCHSSEPQFNRPVPLDIALEYNIGHALFMIYEISGVVRSLWSRAYASGLRQRQVHAPTFKGLCPQLGAAPFWAAPVFLHRWCPLINRIGRAATPLDAHPIYWFRSAWPGPSFIGQNRGSMEYGICDVEDYEQNSADYGCGHHDFRNAKFIVHECSMCFSPVPAMPLYVDRGPTKGVAPVRSPAAGPLIWAAARGLCK